MPYPLFVEVKLGILKVSPSALSLECFQVWRINLLAGWRVGWLGTGRLASTWSALSQRWDKGYLGYIICSFQSLINLSLCFANGNAETWTISWIRQSRLPHPAGLSTTPPVVPRWVPASISISWKVIRNADSPNRPRPTETEETLGNLYLRSPAAELDTT